MNKVIVYLVLTTICIFSQSQAFAPFKNFDKTDNIFFIENKGQWSHEILFLASNKGMNAWITNTGVIYDHYIGNLNYDEMATVDFSSSDIEEFKRNNSIIKGHVVELGFVNTNKNAKPKGMKKNSAYYNFFIGNDQNNWQGNVGLFEVIEINEIFEGIGIKYYFENGLLRYDYHVNPNADINKIKFKIEGEDNYSINNKGELVIHTSVGEIVHGKLYAYQEDRSIECKFKETNEGLLSIDLGEYDNQKKIIVDPLIYSTFIGGINNDTGHSIAIDNEGNTYITGQTYSWDFPTTLGAYQTLRDEYEECFVSKINSAGSELIFSTFLGGWSLDEARSIAVDENGNTYITGTTVSDNFPVTNESFQKIYGGMGDAFVAKFNSSGNELTYSTFIGGSETDSGNSIKIDENGNTFITGVATSPDFPNTLGVFQSGKSGSKDAFVTKLNSTGSKLEFSTFIGGSLDEFGNSIAIDSDGNSYITGYTYSPDYPITLGCYQTVQNGGEYKFDAFISKINSDGSKLIYSSFIGGNNDDVGNSIAIDNEKNVFVAGNTKSANFPTTPFAFQINYNGETDGFVLKFDTQLNNLLYSSYLGKSKSEHAECVVVDNYGNAFITGTTYSDNFPVTENAEQKYFGGYADIFISVLNQYGSELLYSTFFGGRGEFGEFGESLAIDEAYDVYVTGKATSIPIIGQGFQQNNNGHFDSFLLKLNVSIPSMLENSRLPNNFTLLQNFPNPFNPNTTITYGLPVNSQVELSIYSILGEKITELVNSLQEKGFHKVSWNAKNLSSGVYILKINATYQERRINYSEMKKMILLK